MIDLLIYCSHVVVFTAGFTRRWQEAGISEGLLTVFFMALIFFVGWSMSSFIMKLALPPEGWGPALDRDTAALLLLTVAEGAFYYFYLKNDTPGGGGTPSGT